MNQYQNQMTSPVTPNANPRRRISFDPLSPKQVDAHKRDAVRIARWYLGIGSKPRARSQKRDTTAPKQAVEASVGAARSKRRREKPHAE